MGDVISIREYGLRRDLKLANNKLCEVRILIEAGEHKYVEQARALEEIIERIEEELLRITEQGIF